jgi:hypothetical protein
MIRHFAVQPKAVEPSVRQVQVDLFTQTPLGPGAQSVPNHQHPYDQLRINRRPPKVAIMGLQLLTHGTKIKEVVDLAQHVISRDMRLQIEVIKQLRWSFLSTHHRQIPPFL